MKEKNISRKLTYQDLQNLAETRNHTVVSFENYQNVRSKIIIHCQTCECTWETTVHNYKYGPKTGCPECKKRIASQTHKGKVTTEETKSKIGLKAKQRPGSLTGKTGNLHPRFKGGLARDLRNPSNADFAWKTGVRKRCGHRCVISLEKVKRSGAGFACHHLNSFDLFEDQRYLLENGVYLKREIHSQFHQEYGFGNNTEAQFVEFCLKFYNINWQDRKKQLHLT